MGKTTEISWLHYYIPESRFPAGMPKRVWLQHEPEAKRVKVLGATFNPQIGCAPAVHPSGPVAQGCVNCYAAALNRRFKWNGTGTWGRGVPRKLASESTWEQALGWARDAAKLGLRRRWFFSLGDPLDPEVPAEWRARLWDFIRTTAVWPPVPWGANSPDETQRQLSVWGGLDAYLLTKRPWLWERIPEDVRPLIRLGTSASDQESWDIWVGDLVKARGFAGLFVSLEPMIASVDASRLLRRPTSTDLGHDRPVVIDQIIVGGESGPKARPFRLEWARSVRDQCRAATGVKFFMKQVGSRPYPTPGFDEWPRGLPEDSAGADMSEWPEDLRIQEVPT